MFSVKILNLRFADASRRSDELNWTLVYNGTETKWPLSGLKVQESFAFTVSAHNIKGWGEMSEASNDVIYNPILPRKILN